MNMKENDSAEIITTNRDENVCADIKMSNGESEWHGHSGKIYKMGPYTKRDEYRFTEMHNLTEKEIREEIRFRLRGSIWPIPNIQIFSIYLKQGNKTTHECPEK